MALSKKILLPTCAPAHGDIVPYFFFRKNISIRWRNMCFSDVTPKWHRKLIPPKIAAFHRLLRRMELSIKFLSLTCAPAHGDIAPYFFFEKIFRSDGEMCVSMTPFWGLGQFGGYVTETHISPSDRNIFSKKICSDIF